MNLNDLQENEITQLLELINMSGEGLPKHLWSKLALHDPASSVESVALALLQDKNNALHASNFHIAKNHDGLQGACCAFQLDTVQAFDNFLIDRDVVWPLAVLQSSLLDSWFISSFGVRSKNSLKDIGSSLITKVESDAISNSISTVSVIISSQNKAMKNFFEQQGYALFYSLPIIEFDGLINAGDWQLLCKHV